MELIEQGFANGVVDCYRVWEDDSHRNAVAGREMERAKAAGEEGMVKRLIESVKDTKVPLWQRVSGLTSERSMRPALRRERIRKLLKTADQILRAELKTPVRADQTSVEPCTGLDALRTERSVFWDPLPEMCFYLEIGQSKLAQYSRQLTGLGARDLVDRIRVENLRASIRERLRKVVGQAQANSKEDVKRLSVRDGAGVLLKALKASEHFVARQEMALSVGIASKGRLYRACLACERKTLEEIEREEAAGVFAEMRETMEAAVVSVGSAPTVTVSLSASVDGVKTD